mmetsp:Transcript_7948/g.21064  ORF Transcript_7948/g.21064 Transcript_7948/m.21064 type:complete len:232 (-) Transcript_7948:90-785(-)
MERVAFVGARFGAALSGSARCRDSLAAAASAVHYGVALQQQRSSRKLLSCVGKPTAVRMAASDAWVPPHHTMNIVDAVMKANETDGFATLADADVKTLQGIGAKGEAGLHALGLTTVRKLAAWKYGRWAQAIVTMAELERAGARPEGCSLNLDLAVDKAHEHKSLQELIALPPSALQGLTSKADEELKKVNLTTIAKLGQWKFLKIAQAIVELAEVEQTQSSENRKSKAKK